MESVTRTERDSERGKEKEVAGLLVLPRPAVNLRNATVFCKIN